MLGDAGRLKDAMPIREQLRMLEPFVPVYNTNTALIMIASGQREAAIRLLESVPDDSATGFTRHDYLARAYVRLGRRSEAADTLLSSPQTVRVSRQSIEDASRLLRSPPRNVGSAETLPTLEGQLVWVYAYAGARPRGAPTISSAIEPVP